MKQYEKLRKRSDELSALALPLIEFIKKYFNPHTKIIVDINSAEVVTGECMVRPTEVMLDKETP
jgi:hypothetical protein